ncbi:MAG: DUF2703 domain-containing protein [Methanoregulaceae archaeon]|nr:DUF2703 domain-containing protein [Methanoregulaceae archaeon]
MKREVVVEWRHSPGEDDCCIRCEETGKDFHELLRDLHPALLSEGIQVRVVESIADPAQGQVNRLLLNGVPVENLVGEAARAQGWCSSRRCEKPALAFTETLQDGKRCEVVPELLLRKAILLALEEEERTAAVD